MRRLAVVLATLAALLASAPARVEAAGPSAVTYRPPVVAPVVDPFRPPAENWNAGNRGLEYATTAGTPVGASAAGEVVFAGPVADGLHVVVLHDDGLRTSYSFLQSIAVRRGDTVRQGQTVGTAQARFHFGVRAGDAYLDPAKLFGGGPPEVYLVPDELRRPQTEAQERAGLARMFQGWAGRAASAAGAAFDWAKDTAAQKLADQFDELRGLALLGHEGQPLTHVTRFLSAAHDWWQARDTCTPASVATPRLQERRIAVKVAGLGSSSAEGSVDKVDYAGLGYAASDVVRYSYLGGTTEENPYVATDTDDDIHVAARRLRELLQRMQAEHPGVPIDVIAHSQGGIVARVALTDEVDPTDPRLPAVKSLITLSSPHRGAPVATALTMAAHTTPGDAAEKLAHTRFPDMIDPQGKAVTQLAEQSSFWWDVNSRRLPPGLNVTSIGAREDWMVPAGVTHLDGARNVTVSVPGLKGEHSKMPEAAETHREIALGLAGMEPTCQSLGDALADAAVSDYIRMVEHGAATVTWMGGSRLDKKIDVLPTPTVPRRSD